MGFLSGFSKVGFVENYGLRGKTFYKVLVSFYMIYENKQPRRYTGTIFDEK